MRVTISAVLASCLAVPLYAGTAINGLTVNPVQGGFEVISGVGSGPRQFWCAAGDHALRIARSQATDRIFIAKPLGPSSTKPGRNGVVFTLAPKPAISNGPRLGSAGNYSVRLKTAGFNLSAGHAHGFCVDVWEKLTDRRPSMW